MSNPANDQFTIGLSHHRSGRFDDAIYYYQKALDKDPELPQALINLAVIHLEKKKFEEAENLLKTADRISPKNAKVLANFANIYQNNGHYIKSEKYYLDSIKADPTIAANYCNLGSLYLKREENEKAIDILMKSVEVDPKLKNSHVVLGATLIKLGRFEEAERSLLIATKLDPKDSDALLHLGILEYSKNNFSKAEELFRTCVNLKPDWVVPVVELAKSISKQGRLDDADTYYRSGLRLNPEYIPGLISYGILEIENKNFDKAQKHLDKAKSLAPDMPEVSITLGELSMAREDFKEALNIFKTLITKIPDHIEGNLHYGITLQKLDLHDLAIQHFNKMLEKNPISTEALNNIANSYNEINLHDKAIESYEKAIKLNPTFAVLFTNLGNSYRNASRYEDAIKTFKKSIKLDPKDPRSYNGLGLTYQAMNKEHKAVESYKKAIELEPDYPEAPNNLAVSLQNLGDYYEAIKVYKDLIEKHPDKSQIYFNLGGLLQVYGKHDESLVAFRQALEKDPKNNLVYPFYAHALMQQCKWENLEAVVTKVIENTKMELKNEVMPCVSPFGLQCMPASKDIRQRVAVATSNRFTKHLRYQKTLMENLKYKNPENRKLKIGFVSADFRGHSVAVAFKGVLEYRDKENFEYHAYAISTYGQDNLTEEFKLLFDTYTDITEITHENAAKKIFDDGINILVDLTGHTRGCRYEVFSLRPAPIQAHWLGFSSTTGADFIDYLITDEVQNPLSEEEYITEKLVHLPDTFMATSHPIVSNEKVSRKEENLPENGFVFCNFNGHYKFYPSMFSIWMRLLRKTPESVIWLMEGSEKSKNNLIIEAKKRGVNSDRLIFAKNYPHDKHLARLKLANLCLDNIYHGGGVTTTDALWTKVPVITLYGETPPARNGATLLTALNVPELITYSLREYEEKALQLSSNNEELNVIRNKINVNLNTTPLFNISLFTKNLEKSFKKMWERHNEGLKPDHIKVQ